MPSRWGPKSLPKGASGSGPLPRDASSEDTMGAEVPRRGATSGEGGKGRREATLGYVHHQGSHVGWYPSPGSESPSLVLVIEWQPRWIICVWCEIHRWLVHRYTSVSNICHGGEMAWSCCNAQLVWWRSSLHMRHDKDRVASVKGKSKA
jgi:hypothetical protein